MFKLRLLTALILIPLVLLGLYYISLPVFWFVLLFIVLAAGIEWLQLIPLRGKASQFCFLLSLVLASYLIHFVFDYWLALGLVLWAISAVFIILYPRLDWIWGRSWLMAFLGLYYLPLFAQSLVALFQQKEGRFIIIYLLFLVWVADTGAYIVGKIGGKHKLIPKVSPGKTVEGLAGGLSATIVIGFVGFYFLQPESALLWYVFVLFMYLVTVMGDLFFSMLKRRVKIKDTGHIFPGHGGILDRLDSLIAASPFFYLGYYLIMHGF